MVEHRQGPRIRCHLPCELVRRGRSTPGRLRDLSAAGLAVQTALDADEGEDLRVIVKPRRGRPVELDAIVWHRHRVRRRSDGETGLVLGLVLSRPADAWFDRVGAPRPTVPHREATARAGADACDSEARTVIAFQVRIRQKDSPRSRVLHIEAPSAEDARRLVLSEVGTTWNVLEVRPA